MKFSIVISFLIALALPLQSLAEDIDLFLGSPPDNGEKPNVLIILDNTANWNTAFEVEKKALVDTFDNMDPNGFSVGLMMFGESPQLGYVKAAIREMSLMENGETFNHLYADMIDKFCVSSGNCSSGDGPGDGANARSLSRTFSEAYRYLTGARSVDDSINTGQGKNDHREYPDNTYSTAESTIVHNLPLPALSGEFVFDYLTPPDTGACGKTYVIYIGNTVPSGNVTKDKPSRNNPAGDELVAAGGDRTAISEGYTVEGAFYDAHYDNYADEWARFMHDEMGVIFYAVDVDPTPFPPEEGGHGNGIGNSILLKSLSQGVGGGKYFRVNSADPNDVQVTLSTIFSEIQAENSVFASVALPASTTGQSVFLNQVFIGLFRPDEIAAPRWPGNLKQYKLGIDNGKIKLFDARNLPGINTGTGFVDDCARSYWTDPDPDGYWLFSPAGTCPPANTTNLSTSDSPDGPYVEKGAQATVMRSKVPTTRTVYTCDSTLSSCSAASTLQDFNTTQITGGAYETLFNATDAADLANLVNWAIGVDLDDDNELGDYTDTRAWIHGDVIHSRPIALNYGDRVNPAVIVVYGANDGMLRVINGNQSADVYGYAPGEELWAFMPPEFYGEIKRLKVNTEVVKFPATGPAAGATGTRKAYGMDGVITAYEGEVDVSGSPVADQKYVYATMRRGGRAVYGFDVSDPNDPAFPELLWKKGCDDSGCSIDTDDDSNGWADIGETWSSANVAYVTDRANPVLIMGGGYDECEDTDNGGGGANHSCVAGDHGDHIYVLDAVSGDLLAVHDTLRAVPGGITIVAATDATNDNPHPDIAFAYATDTGGNVYRISGPLDVDGNATIIGSSAPIDWLVTRIAAFGCGPLATTICNPNRKFLFGPDVVRSLSDSMIFRVLVGSGDREKPLLSYSATQDVENYFYSFVDQPLVSATWMDVDTDCGADMFCHGLMAEVTVNEVVTPGGREVEIVIPDGVDIVAAKGYRLKLAATEQVVTGALVVGDIANFSTHIPYDVDVDEDDDADVCFNKLGTATTYNIDFEAADGGGVDIFTGGLVPTPVAGLVELCDGDVCTEEPFCIGCGGENSPIGGGVAGAEASYEQSKGRVYWNIEQ